jgi:hypothetical protein
MGQVFLRGLLHQKLFGRSPPVHDSATRFHRHRRAADPSPFFNSTKHNRLDAFFLCSWATLPQNTISARDRQVVNRRSLINIGILGFHRKNVIAKKTWNSKIRN